MDLLEAIHGRQTISKLKDEPVPRELIEKILSAAVQAPNHHQVRPWRFVVLTGDGRKKLGAVMAASFLDRFPATPPEGLDKTRALPLRAPVVIAVGADQPSESRIVEIENVSAASIAAYLMALSAQAFGLGAILRTGDWARDVKVKEFLGFAPDQHIVGFLYLGYPEVLPAPYTRPGFEDRTVWMEK
ncbi:MAG: nitroreductase [Anaerolineales bacterium]|nr:nitroreductase [Anaerolineales bacterium]